MRRKRSGCMNNTFFEEVGNNIQNILLRQGKTQQFLADQLGVSKQVMSKIISGSKAINVEEISNIARNLNVEIEELLAVKTKKEESHYFSFMGRVENEDTRKKIELLKEVIDEILFLEEYADEK